VTSCNDSRVFRIMQRHCEFLEESISCWITEASSHLQTWPGEKALELAEYLDKTSKAISSILEESLKFLSVNKSKHQPEETNDTGSIRSRQVSKDTTLDFSSFNPVNQNEISDDIIPGINHNWRSCKIPIKKLTSVLKLSSTIKTIELNENHVSRNELPENSMKVPGHVSSTKTPLEITKERSKGDSGSAPDLQKYGTEEESRTSEDRPLFVFTSQEVHTEFYSYRLFKFSNLSKKSRTNCRDILHLLARKTPCDSRNRRVPYHEL
jgi:hypothetical protein